MLVVHVDFVADAGHVGGQTEHDLVDTCWQSGDHESLGFTGVRFEWTPKSVATPVLWLATAHSSMNPENEAELTCDSHRETVAATCPPVPSCSARSDAQMSGPESGRRAQRRPQIAPAEYPTGESSYGPLHRMVEFLPSVVARGF